MVIDAPNGWTVKSLLGIVAGFPIIVGGPGISLRDLIMFLRRLTGEGTYKPCDYG